MKYSFTCPCQKVIPVDISSAGSDIVCECGSKAQVPRLSQLRVMAGEGAYEAGTIDTILRMLDEGTLPWRETCAITGRPTRDVIEVYVECEKVHSSSNHGGWLFLAVMLLGWMAVLLKGAVKEHDPQGRETRVRTPLRVERDVQAVVLKMKSQRKLRRLLRQVPIYARLLDAYPEATIVVGKLPTEGDMRFAPGFAS
jgi:hypothetical protein